MVVSLAVLVSASFIKGLECRRRAGCPGSRIRSTTSTFRSENHYPALPTFQFVLLFCCSCCTGPPTTRLHPSDLAPAVRLTALSNFARCTLVRLYPHPSPPLGFATAALIFTSPSFCPHPSVPRPRPRAHGSEGAHVSCSADAGGGAGSSAAATAPSATAALLSSEMLGHSMWAG